MSAVLFKEMAGARTADPPRQKIRRVSLTEQCTLVVKQGSRMVRLQFAEPVTVTELRSYCTGQLAWEGLDGLDVVVSGQRYNAGVAGPVLLQPGAERVDFGDPLPNEQAPKVVEFTRRTPAKG